MTREGSNFIREISEAYQALEREPELRRQLDELQHHHHRDGEHIARLESRIHEMKLHAEELTAKLRSVEAERDEATFRVLEEADKANAAKRSMSDLHSVLGGAIAAIAGDAKDMSMRFSQAEWTEWEEYNRMKAERAEYLEREALAAVQKAEAERLEAERIAALPTPVPVDTTTTGTDSGQSVTEGPSAVDPTTAPIQSEAPSKADISASFVEPTSEAPEVPPASHPIVSMAMPGQSPPAPSATAETAGSAASLGSEPPRGKYFGIRYADHSFYVNRENWIAGGGDADDYDNYYREATFLVLRDLPEPTRS
jgi:hypothetical protein